MDRTSSECPFVNCNDARCADRFQVAQLDEFFALCCGNYRRCQTYHRLRAEGAHGALKAALPAVAMTAHGRELRVRSLFS